jgi:hypothetical protein
MPKVIIMRALPWGRDARVERWAKIYSQYKPLFGVWGASDLSQSVKSITSIIRNPNSKTLIGLGYLWFSLASFYFVLKNAKKNDVVVFIDLETILVAWIAAIIKGAKIHYDMADPFYLAKPIPGKQFWKFIESLFVKKSFRVTAPHISRLSIFTEKITPNMSVIENVPYFKEVISLDRQKTATRYITLGYFGGLEANVRGLENIARLVLDDDRLKLIIAGTGQLSTFFTKISQQCNRIIYLRAFSPEDLPKIAKETDVYIAYYSPDKFLHTIAAPNKYYEHLFLGIPILTSCVIPQAHEVCNNKTGWCIENDTDALIKWKNELFNSEIDWNEYKERCQTIWKEKYADYYSKNQIN